MAVSRADSVSQLAKKVETYSDFVNNFTKHPITNELVIVKNDDSVRQAFKNLILTNIGERPFSPFFGSKVNETLFENFSAFTREDIIRYIQMSARMFERRIQLLNVSVTEDQNRNGLKINIVFSIINNTEPTSLSIFLKRVR
jgi:phage baseplate assembly protein W